MRYSRLRWIITAVVAMVFCAFSSVQVARALPDVDGTGPSVIYDGASKRLYGTNITDGELFAAFKGLIPGDTREQHFKLVAQNLERPATVYLRSECDEATRAALAETQVVISVDGREVARKGFHEVSSASLSEGVKLASFSADGSKTVTVRLEVPTSVGNELMDTAHQIDWVFVVQEDGGSGQNGSTTTGGSDALLPRTGDDTLLLAWGVFAAGMLMFGLHALYRLREARSR